MAHTYFALLEISVLFALIHLSSAILPPYIGGDLRHEIARGERRANQELLQYGFELFWNNILSKVNFIFWIQSFYPTNMDFIIRHSYFPRLHSFFSWIQRYVFIPEIQSSCWDPKLLLRIQGFTSDPKIQTNLILRF